VGAAGASPWGPGVPARTQHRPGDRASPRGPSSPAHPACAQAPGRREANGRVLGYRVTLSPRRRGRDPPTVCNTTHTQCNFSAPAGTRRVYLSAYNAAGESAPTEVVLLERKGEGSANLPPSETSTEPPGALPPGSSTSSQTGCRSLAHRREGTSLGLRPGGSRAAARGAHSPGEGLGLGAPGAMRRGCSPLPSSRRLSPRRPAAGRAPGRARGRAQPLGALGGPAGPTSRLRPRVGARGLGARPLLRLLADGAWQGRHRGPHPG